MDREEAVQPAFTVMFWGDTQTGKTTLGTAAFCGSEGRPAAIDKVRSAEAINAAFFSLWRKLRTGRHIQPTATDHIDVDLVTRAGATLRLRDTKGQLTRKVHEPAVVRRIGEADALVLVVEWNGRDLERQMDAVDAGSRLAGNRPAALVFTKCELGLAEDSPDWNAAPGWWSGHETLRPHRHVLSRFGPAVFPTSAYGFHARTGKPAVILGEFGQPLPYGISPRGVWQPFEWLFSRLGLE